MGFGKIWHGIKRFGKGIGRGLGKAAHWAYDHRGQIINGVGKAGKILGDVGMALDATGVGAELGVPLGQVGSGLSAAAAFAGDLNQNFLGQSHKPDAFRNPTKDPNASLSHLPFKGKMASQGLSDHISKRKSVTDVINSSRDLVNKIGEARKGAKTLGDRGRNLLTRGMKRGRLGMPPPFFANKRTRTANNLQRPPTGVSLGEMNVRNYNSQPTYFPTAIKKRQRAEQFGAGRF